MKSSRLNCLACGSEISQNDHDDHGTFVCPFCRREYVDYGKEIEKIARLRQKKCFEEAESRCDELIDEGTTISEVYWQKLLASLRVIFVIEQGKDAKPTFFWPTNFLKLYTKYSIFKDDLYNKAIIYAKEQSTKDTYKKEADAINNLLEEFFRLKGFFKFE